MTSLNKTYVLFLILITFMFSFSNKTLAKYEKVIYDFEIETITGEKIKFSTYKNKVILLVNVASQCALQVNMKICKNYGTNIERKD